MNPLAILDIGSKIIDKIFPDPVQKAQAQVELVKLQQSGQLEELKTEMSVMLAEAQSADKWTSRARPAFLYVCYVMMLSAIPMGIVSAFSGTMAQRIAEGFKLWLAAIPSEFISLMKIVMLGYITGRTVEKIKGAA